MILRRFMKHAKEQNWFAVGLDVIVVIVGIFLGLQVQVWNEGRKERVDEKIYLNRLHSEVLKSIEIVEPALKFKQEKQASLYEVLDIFLGKKEAEALTPMQCFSIITSGVYSDQVISLPTIVELMTSGQLSIIQNDDIKADIIDYNITQDEWREMISDIRDSRVNFVRKYPEINGYDLRMKTMSRSMEGINALNHYCDLDKMKDSVPFKNDVLSATNKIAAINNAFLTDELNRFKNLHQKIDKELGLSHP